MENLFTKPYTPPMEESPQKDYYHSNIHEDKDPNSKFYQTGTGTADVDPPEKLGVKEVFSDPENIKRRDNFLIARLGPAKFERMDDREKNKNFFNIMRSYYGGNSVRTAKELTFQMLADEETLKSYHDGIDLFESVNGFKDDKIRTVWQYAKAGVVDPANLVGPLAASRFAGMWAVKKGATKASKIAVQRALASGVSKQAAQAQGNKVWNRVVANNTEKVLRERALMRLGIAGVTDASANASVDLAFQKGLIHTGNQEDYILPQTAIASFMGVFGSGLEGAHTAIRKNSQVGVFTAPKRNAKRASGVLETMVPNLKTWNQKVADGHIITSGKADQNFWNMFFFGREELKEGDKVVQSGFEGFITALEDNDYFWVKRNPDDKITDFVSDIILSSPTEEYEAFVAEFAKLPGFKSGGGINAKNITRQEVAKRVADGLASTMSDAGRSLNVMKRVADRLRKPVAEVTDQETLEYLKELGKPISHEFHNKVHKGEVEEGALTYLQGKYPEFLVYNPATTAVNVKGWAMRTGLESASSVVEAGNHLVGGLLKSIATGSTGAVSAGYRQAKNIYFNQIFKLKNLINPGAGADFYESMVKAFPKDLIELSSTITGGIDKGIQNIYQPKTGWRGGVEKVASLARSASLMQAQDTLTKGIEFTTAFDLALRRKFNMGLVEFQDLPGPRKAAFMRSERFQDSLAFAVERTAENLFAKSAKDANLPLFKHVGTAVEDIRKIPGIGMLAPFGRFFNNTIMMTHDYSVIAPFFKAVGATGSSKSWEETIAKASVGTAALIPLVEQQRKNIENGVSWNHSENEAGELIDQTNSFPLSHGLAAARIIARSFNQAEGNEENLFNGMPADEWDDIWKTVGIQSFTRNFSDAEKSLIGVATTIITEADLSLKGSGGAFVDILGATAAQGSAGFTRWLETFNMLAKVASEPEYWPLLDAKQGWSRAITASRYTDQFFRQMGIDFGSEPRNDPTRGKVTTNPSKFAGNVPVGPQTKFMQLLSYMGKPHWQAGINLRSPEARNFVNGIVMAEGELQAEIFFKKHPDFASMPVERQILLGREVLEDIRENVIRKSAYDSYNPKMKYLVELTRNHSPEALEDFAKETNDPSLQGKSLEDMTETDLWLLKNWVDNREDVIRSYGGAP